MPWKIARKDFMIVRRKKSVFYVLFAVPMVVAVLFPSIAFLLAEDGSVKYLNLVPYLNAYSFFFVLLSPLLANNLASYSMVGEKLEKTLESLLATPTTDSEILLGKSLASFVPAMLSVWCAGAVFIAFVDITSYQWLGCALYPNWTLGAVLLVVAPLACLFSVEWSVVISSRVSDLRGAQQMGALAGVFPLIAVFASLEAGVIKAGALSLLIIGSILLLVDVILFFLSVATFRREEILTKWK